MEQIGRRVIRLESVDSTNNYTANLVKKDQLDHGSVILAVDQFGGRGQMGAGWLVNPGENLTFTVFLNDVNMSVDQQFDLTVLTSLALSDFLSKFLIHSSIKWPNDIFVDSKKISGVLIENSVQGNTIKKSLLGIGLNVNQLDFGNLNATSMKTETGTHFDLNELVLSLIGSFNKRITQLNSGVDLKKEYLENLYWVNEDHNFKDDSGVFVAKIVGVNELGQLRVIRNEKEKHYSLKEIEFMH